MLIISVLINLVWSCDEWRKLSINTALHENHNQVHQIELVLNDHLKSQVGACHYRIANATGLGAVTIDTAGRSQGFYIDENIGYDIYTNLNGVSYRKAALSYPKKCKEYFKPSTTGHDENNVLRRKRRNTDKSEYKILELIIVISNGIYKNLADHDAPDKTKRMKPVFERFEAVVNSINTLYEMVNLRIIPLDIKVWDEEDKFDMSEKSSGIILDEFKAWIQEQKTKTSGIERARWLSVDNAQLIVPEGTFSDTATIGKGWTSSFCGQYSNGVNEDHSRSHLGVAATMAHEMGHNLGLNHDSSSCTCEAVCIMAASASATHATRWSSCSEDRLKERIHNPSTSWPCLDDTPESSIIYGEPVCGNGLLEKGEDCDCGTTDPEQCNSKCCNAAICKFKDGANCDANDGPCCEDCHLKSAGSVCRDSQSECDLPEYCDGWNARCRNNVYKRNGEPCSESGRCMSGQCLTRDSHCKYIYGQTSYHSSECMEEFNFDNGRSSGQYYGNCGQMKTWHSKCKTKEDSFCGKTQCIDGDSRPVIQEFHHVTIGEHSSSSTNHICKYMDWREEVKKSSRDSDYNFDQMPIGTPCGDESVCDADPSGIRRLCRPLSNLWVDSKWGTCPNNCTGRGWCNSNGNCHCFDGYGGLECHKHGAGGSIDSGHASASKMDEGTKMFILIFSCLFGLLIVGALVAKFKFKKNLTDIFLYQPCAGNYRQNQNKYQFDSRNNQLDMSAPKPNDIFNPDWGDGERPTISSPIREDAPLKSKPVKPPKPVKPSKPIKPAKPQKPVSTMPKQTVPTNFGLVETTNDPFNVDWGDKSIPHRSAPEPPKPPTPPPKDY